MAGCDFDLFVIGAGSGGVRAARLAAAQGLRVGIAEDRYLGGTCVNVGCVPKKLLVYAAQYGADMAEAAGFGWNVGEVSCDWSRLIANKDREIARLNGIYRNLLKQAGATLFEERARLAGPQAVTLSGGRQLTAAHILIATGGWPGVPDIPGREHAITSNEVFYLSQRPRRMLIVGGGYIAVEFAGIMRGLGAEVTQLYRGPLFMRGFDGDVREFLAAEMRKQGIDLRFNANPARISKDGDSYRVILESGEELDTDCVFFATGRRPNSASLGLEVCGVALAKNGAVIVDEDFRTNVESVYALGDVIDRVALTPVAIAEATCFIANTFGDRPRKMDYRDIPSAVFSRPPVGALGLDEDGARARYGEVDVYLNRFRPMRHNLTGNPEQALMKLIVDRKSDRVVGLHMVGADAGEILQGFAVAFTCGATKADFDATVGIHPTGAEEFVTMRTPKPPE